MCVCEIESKKIESKRTEIERTESSRIDEGQQRLKFCKITMV